MKHKPKVSLLVAKDVALKGGGSAFATSSGVDLTNGQLGIYDASGKGVNAINVSVADTVTPFDSPELFLAQGTPFSAAPLTAVGPADQVANQTQAIKSSTVKSVTYQPATTGVLSGWAIEDVNADSNTAYSFGVAFRSRIKDRNYTQTAAEIIQVNFPTGDLSSFTSAEDYLIQNLVAQTNTFSKIVSTNGRTGNRDVVAFAINTDGTASSGIAINSAAGTATGYGFTLTQEMVNALAGIVTASALTNSSKIVPIDLTNAGNATTTKADAVVVLGLNRDLAVGYDRIDQIKTRIQVGLKNGFDLSTVTLTEGSLAKEAQGTPRVWRRFFEDTVGQRIYGKNKTLFPFAYQYPDYIDDTKTYGALVLEYESEPYRRDHSLTVSNHKAIILVPSDATNGIKASLTTFLSLWLPNLTTPTIS
jgi:hypothetical protein